MPISRSLFQTFYIIFFRFYYFLKFLAYSKMNEDVKCWWFMELSRKLEINLRTVECSAACLLTRYDTLFQRFVDSSIHDLHAFWHFYDNFSITLTKNQNSKHYTYFESWLKFKSMRFPMENPSTNRVSGTRRTRGVTNIQIRFLFNPWFSNFKILHTKWQANFERIQLLNSLDSK